MCRWLTYSGRPIFLERLLFEPENSLIQQSLHARKAVVATNGDGFGVGWYGDRETPGTYREILPAWNDRNLKSLAHQLRSSLFFAHVRASTGTATSRANCHPFTCGKWLFMHNGQIGGYPVIRRRLDQLIPDYVYPFREGTTDSELIFYLLFRHGLDKDPAEALARTVGEIIPIMQEADITDPLRLTIALSDGKRSWVARYSTDDHPPTLYWCDDDDELTVVSEPLDAAVSHWNAVPPSHMLMIENGRLVEQHGFTPL